MTRQVSPVPPTHFKATRFLRGSYHAQLLWLTNHLFCCIENGALVVMSTTATPTINMTPTDDAPVVQKTRVESPALCFLQELDAPTASQHRVVALTKDGKTLLCWTIDTADNGQSPVAELSFQSSLFPPEDSAAVVISNASSSLPTSLQWLHQHYHYSTHQHFGLVSHSSSHLVAALSPLCIDLVWCLSNNSRPTGRVLMPPNCLLLNAVFLSTSQVLQGTSTQLALLAQKDGGHHVVMFLDIDDMSIDANNEVPKWTLSDPITLPLDSMDCTIMSVAPFRSVPSAFAVATKSTIYCYQARQLLAGSRLPFMKLMLDQLLLRQQPTTTLNHHGDNDEIVSVAMDTNAPPMHDRMQILTRNGHLIGLSVNESESMHPLFRPQLTAKHALALSVSPNGTHIGIHVNGKWEIYAVPDYYS